MLQGEACDANHEVHRPVLSVNQWLVGHSDRILEDLVLIGVRSGDL